MLKRATGAILWFVAAASAADAPPVVHRIADKVHYSGDLTAPGLRRLQAAHAGEATWLVVNSGGGEVNVAMNFGDWVFAEHLNVRVSDRCLSACANYVFTAAAVKVIEPGAIVAWHGSAALADQSSREAIEAVIARDILPRTAESERDAVRVRLLDETLTYVARARARQAGFFRKTGVDEQVTRLGIGHPAVKDFWFLSVEVMQHFGIDRVVAPATYTSTNTDRFGDGNIVWLDIQPAAP